MRFIPERIQGFLDHAAGLLIAAPWSVGSAAGGGCLALTGVVRGKSAAHDLRAAEVRFGLGPETGRARGEGYAG